MLLLTNAIVSCGTSKNIEGTRSKIMRRFPSASMVTTMAATRGKGSMIRKQLLRIQSTMLSRSLFWTCCYSCCVNCFSTTRKPPIFFFEWNNNEVSGDDGDETEQSRCFALAIYCPNYWTDVRSIFEYQEVFLCIFRQQQE